ncbi:exonuclease subunit SbcD [Flavobacterium degerlachei]|jgi:exonuclease SbcD|uniref:Nuclease SbcCD subunit D n=1 Tax=Flavobacterium degerlachei TaxID=229203 RepID=A0A1H3E107_9FLAO|nr:exonuclease subunit SbcD [Flavobacterium degerlachei]SDX72351.1 Exodeoxyribonuclease I subunit D [Flavobacterium degerlachei]
MSIKILHTADWHIGKQLLKIDFAEDMNLFFDWLIKCIEDNNINVLLMSGDLFDQANPSQQAMKQYYYFLKQLLPLKCKVVLTGGNHDSPHVINAPKELLEILDIKVVGGVPETISELFVEIEIEDQKVVVAAVPFLRDKDIRNVAAGESYDDKIELIRHGIATYFAGVNEYYNANHSSVPFIVMAHLYAQGASVSESEREIQIGNQAGVESAIFGEEPDYVALGHIHRPQMVGKPHIRYSGSPIALSFSEKKDIKEVTILELEGNNFTISSLATPKFRKLLSIKGTVEEVQKIISDYKSESPLIDLAEVLIEEENENIEHIRILEELLTTEPQNGLQILKGSIKFKNEIAGTSKLLTKGEDINDFSPVQLFEKRLEQDASIENTQDFVNAFKEIMEALQSSDSID